MYGTSVDVSEYGMFPSHLPHFNNRYVVSIDITVSNQRSGCLSTSQPHYTKIIVYESCCPFPPFPSTINTVTTNTMINAIHHHVTTRWDRSLTSLGGILLLKMFSSLKTMYYALSPCLCAHTPRTLEVQSHVPQMRVKFTQTQRNTYVLCLHSRSF